MSKNLEILNELKMNAPTLLLLKEKNVHINKDNSIEKAYFDKLQDIVLSQYKVETATMGEEDIPKGYFNKMQSQVIRKVTDKKKFGYIQLLKYASVLVFIIVSILAIDQFLIQGKFNGADNESLVQMFDDFSDEELLMVLDNYATNKYTFNLLLDKGLVDLVSNDMEDEDMKILNYLNINEYDLYEAY